MNSEELEKSLRTEFESHLKSVLADMRQEFSEFQEKIEAEFDKHKSQLGMVFQDFSARFDTSRDLEEGFKETVIEHLRLARDEGARITATAMVEAEEMEKQSAPQHLAIHRHLVHLMCLHAAAVQDRAVQAPSEGRSALGR